VDVAARLEAVEIENDMLREQVARLEELMGMTSIIAPIEFRLTPHEGRVFGVLMAREVATKDAIMASIYLAQGKDEAAIKIVDVFICKIRAKLKPFDIEIGTVWGTGYYLASSTKARIREMLSQAVAA
jgi:two-component system cell cycle response regulator CtrA